MSNDLSTPTIPKLALNVAEAAEALSISERSVWAMINRGELPHVRLGDHGGRVVLPVRELTDFLTRKAATCNVAVASGQGDGASPRATSAAIESVSKN